MPVTVTNPSFVLVFRSLPLAGGRVSAGMDLILTAASFDQSVTPVFIGDGLNILLAHDIPSQAMKNPATTLGALALYGIEQLVVSETDARALEFDMASSPLPLLPMDDAAIRSLLKNASQVMVF